MKVELRKPGTDTSREAIQKTGSPPVSAGARYPGRTYGIAATATKATLGMAMGERELWLVACLAEEASDIGGDEHQMWRAHAGYRDSLKSPENECAHGRLLGDQTPKCGCWAE